MAIKSEKDPLKTLGGDRSLSSMGADIKPGTREFPGPSDGTPPSFEISKAADANAERESESPLSRRMGKLSSTKIFDV